MKEMEHIHTHSYFYFWRKCRKNKIHSRHYNLVKFYFISTVLDMLVEYKYKEHMDKVLYAFISNKLYNNHAIPEFVSKVKYEECINFVRDMEWMRLIDIDSDKRESIILSDEGLKAYETQYFHSIYSSLLEAYSSRIILRNVVIIAILSVLIAIIGFSLN